VRDDCVEGWEGPEASAYRAAHDHKAPAYPARRRAVDGTATLARVLTAETVGSHIWEP
jgi:hypothetical protein